MPLFHSMKIKLIQTGKTHFPAFDSAADMYAKRIRHFCPFDIEIIQLSSKAKTNDIRLQKESESEAILKKITPTDFLVLLDDKGKTFSSENFAKQLNQWSVHHASIVFLIGGAYGFSDSLYQRANYKLSLSAFTFSHQMVRLIFSEQLYRAFCILNNHPYHHE